MKRMFSFVLLAFFAMQSVALAASPSVSARYADTDARSSLLSDRPETPSLGVIVRFRDEGSASLGAQLLAAIHDAPEVPERHRRGRTILRTPFTHTAEQFAAQLMLEAPGLEYAEPNYLRAAQAYEPPSDPDFTSTDVWYQGDPPDLDYYVGGKHWWQTAMQAPGAWERGEGDTYPTHGTPSDVKVAVLDTGFYLSHPEFSGGTVTAGIDECEGIDADGVVTSDDDVSPYETGDLAEDSHGTAAAAAVGAEVNGVGTVGTGWNPSIVCYKVAGPLTEYVPGYQVGQVLILDDFIAWGIEDATDAGCKVITISLGGPEPSETLQNAINYAYSRGVVVCASAGNDNAPIMHYPASCTNVVGVGGVQRFGGSDDPATDGAIGRWSAGYGNGSNYGSGMVDLVAPSDMFWTAFKPGEPGPNTPSEDAVPGYDFWAGTSFATPAVAGAFAYLWRAMPSYTNAEIINLMQQTAADLGPSGRDNQYGHGLVNMSAAYNRLITLYPMLIKPTITAGTHQRPGSSVSWSTSSGYHVIYQVSVDGGPPATLSAASYVLPPMSDGAHVLSVVPTSTRNWSSASTVATKTIIWDSIAPVISSLALAGESVTWNVSDTASCTVQGYLNSGTPAVLSANSLSIAGLGSGTHTAYVRATDTAGNTSGWITLSFDLNYEAPSVESVTATDVASVPMSWAPVADAIAYEYRVGSGAIETTTSSSVSVSGLVGGGTPFAVRAVFSGDHRSAWSGATITMVYTMGAPCALGAAAAASTVAYPSTAIRVNGSISATSVPVGIQSSADGARWSDVATVTAGAVSPGFLTAVLPQTTSMRYRFVFRGSGEWAAATSNVVSVAYAPRLTTPSTPSCVKRKAKFYTYSFASAPAANGSAVMTFKFERYQRSGKRYKWVVRKSVSTKGTVYSASSMRYRVRTYMSYTGKWRVKAYYSGAPMYTTATSGYRYFRVK